MPDEEINSDSTDSGKEAKAEEASSAEQEAGDSEETNVGEPDQAEEQEKSENEASNEEESTGEETPTEKGTFLNDREKESLLKEILSKETFIDPLDPELIVKSYSVYDADPQKIIKALITSFQVYCKKTLREAAILRKKNLISIATSEEAIQIRTAAVKEIFDSVSGDLNFERKLMMVIFKVTYWNWLLFGLKDIFREQRALPGNPINNQLNIRFHKLKDEKGFQTVAELVISDITEILNAFKAEITSKSISIFGKH